MHNEPVFPDCLILAATQTFEASHVVDHVIRARVAVARHARPARANPWDGQYMYTTGGPVLMLQNTQKTCFSLNIRVLLVLLGKSLVFLRSLPRYHRRQTRTDLSVVLFAGVVRLHAHA